MARALRVVIPGGWYHVTSRGQRREALFHQDVDRRRFLGLVSELPDRYGVEIHAYVLMDNHYHLLVRTPLGRPWKTMVETHGDWGRDGVMFVAVRFARYRLPEVVREIPGVRYGAAAQAVQRFAKSLETDPEKSRFVKRLRRQLSNE